MTMTIDQAKAEHSPTPWTNKSSEYATYIDDADGGVVRLNVANTDHIVTCVNAMDGVSIEDMPHVVRLGVHMLAEARRLHEDGYCVTREDTNDH